VIEKANESILTSKRVFGGYSEHISRDDCVTDILYTLEIADCINRVKLMEYSKPGEKHGINTRMGPPDSAVGKSVMEELLPTVGKRQVERIYDHSPIEL
jgi:hypothetical protein